MNLGSLKKNKKEIFIFYKEKKYKKVLKYGEKLIKKIPNDYELINILGVSSINLEEFREAEKYFKKLLSLKQTPELYYNYANILKKLKKYKEAINFFNKAISLNPNFSEAYNNLGNTNKSINNHDEAIKNFQKSINIKIDNLEAYFNLAYILRENKKFKEAKNIYQKILKVDQNNIYALNDIGVLDSIYGKISTARKYFIKVIKKNNLFLESYKNYIEITKIDKNDQIFKELNNLNPDFLNEQDKINMFYSLSKGYFDLNNNKIGFEYLEKSKKLKIIKSNFSIKNQKKLFKDIKNYFDVNYLKNVNHQLDIKNNPIFILGMPRSGTTIVEQILSSHSKVFGSGELDCLPKIMDEINLKNENNFENVIKKIRADYYNKIKKLSNKLYITDKLPMNFQWIGFIKKAFPEAKIIHLTRNPMAICWSNYKINFNNMGMNFSLSQEDIAEYYILYKDLMKYWFEKFSEDIIDINYEEFVLNHEKVIKTIINQSNLKWEDNLKYHQKNKRPIETASLYQARGKILQNSSQQWKKYKDYLKPMQDILKANNVIF